MNTMERQGTPGRLCGQQTSSKRATRAIFEAAHVLFDWHPLNQTRGAKRDQTNKSRANGVGAIFLIAG
jgi:hypothetical protein